MLFPTVCFLEHVKGLAYVDFSDDKHLAAAVAKNKQTLLGKRLSIAKSDPKGRKKGSAAAHDASLGRGMNSCVLITSILFTLI